MHIKYYMVEPFCNPTVSVARQELERVGSPKAHVPVNLASTVVKKRPCLKQSEKHGLTPEAVF